MTPPVKRLPESAAQFPSIKYFRDQAEIYLTHEAYQQDKSTPTFSLGEVEVGPLSLVEVAPGVEKPYFKIYYANQELHRMVVGMVQPEEHKLTVSTGPSETDQAPLATLEMKDTCSLTKTLVGAEKKNGDCQDGVVEPKLVAAAQKYPTLQNFDQYCQQSYQDYLAANPSLPREGSYDLKRVQIINPIPQNFGYDLSYENRANAFYCRGHVDTRGMQEFFMASGSLSDYAQVGAEVRFLERAINKEPEIYGMNDACRMSAELVGEQEFHGVCQEYHDFERLAVKTINTSLDVTKTGIELAYMGALIHDAAGWGMKGVDFFLKTKLHSVLFGTRGSATMWVSKKIWGATKWPFVRTWRMGVNALRAVPRLGTAAWQAVPRLMSGARLAFAGAETVEAGVAVSTGTTSSFSLATLGITGVGGVSAAGLSGALLPGTILGVPLGVAIVKSGVGHYLGLEAAGTYLGNKAFDLIGPPKPSTLAFLDKCFDWLS